MKIFFKNGNIDGLQSCNLVRPNFYLLGDILGHSYKMCDLEGFLFCLPLHYQEEPPLPMMGDEYKAAKSKIAQAMSRPCFLVDLFLVDFPVDLTNPTHFYDGTRGKAGLLDLPAIWDYRPDDNRTIRSLKKQIQAFVWELILSDD